MGGGGDTAYPQEFDCEAPLDRDFNHLQCPLERDNNTVTFLKTQASLVMSHQPYTCEYPGIIETLIVRFKLHVVTIIHI